MQSTLVAPITAHDIVSEGSTSREHATKGVCHLEQPYQG